MAKVTPMQVRGPKPNGMNCVRAYLASRSGAKRSGSKRSGSSHSFRCRCTAKIGMTISVPALIVAGPSVMSCAARRVMMGAGG